MIRNSVSSYLKDGCVYIQGYGIRPSGIGMLHGAVHIVPAQEAEILGSVLLYALQTSGKPVPEPADPCRVDNNALLLKAAKAKTWAAMEKAGPSAHAVLRDGKIEITPMRRMGAGAAFIEEKKLICGSENLTELGATLLRAFESAEHT